MSSREKIAALEELLARVQSRAAEPRQAAQAPVRAAPQMIPTPALGTPQSFPRQSIPQAMPTPPPPAPATEPPEAYEDSTEVEVSSEVVEVDIDVEDTGLAGAESGEQRTTSPPDSMEEAPATNAEPDVHVGGNELVEEAPSSSPRPIEPTYEEESAPRHTPPPESGKQVSAAPSAAPPRRNTPPATQLPSTPPPSLEGHTLIGGWREPGLGPGGPGAPPAPGVRAPAPPPSSPAAPPPAAAAPPAAASSGRLAPDVTRPNLGAGKVASFEGAAPAAKPATFGDLLDWTLGL
ncbi:MAG TPA: hypothetical protein VIF62_21860 [Labilithrix sp.]|jgi:hypothetical protein